MIGGSYHDASTMFRTSLKKPTELVLRICAHSMVRT
jgi:hypothetical protein